MTVPIYPPALASAPLNLHTHGLHVSPDGNADNVLLDIPAGMGNTYDYAVPTDMPNGLYWYHSHRHTLTAQQTYLGLAGLLEIGRSDGNLPLVTQNNIPIRNMALQYNFVFDRTGSGHQLNDPNWPQYVSTLTPADGSQLADGTYSPSLAPVNFAETSSRRRVHDQLVRRAAVTGQPPRTEPVHPDQPAELHQSGQERARRPRVARQPAGRAIHRQRTVPTAS